MKLKQARIVAVIAVLAFRLAACGGNPNGPSNQGVTLEGTVVEGQGTGRDFVAANDRGTTAAVVTVSVAENPDLSTTVSGGRFSLRGLPTGSFTLTFASNGHPIGTVAFADVAAASQISVTVAVSTSSVSLISQQRSGGGPAGPQAPPAPQPGPSPSPGATCMINGGRAGEGIELEGRVASGALPTFMMTVNGNRASGQVSILAASAAIRCNGPSTTPAQCTARVTSGAQIHVRGTLTACTTSAATVTASEVKVQN